MSAYLNKNHKGNNPWYVKFRYTDQEGNKQVKVQRGFRSRAEAEKFEKRFLEDIAKDKEFNFEKVVEFYLETVKNKIKLSTADTKEAIISKFILPAFTGKDVRDITTAELIKWQNTYLFERDINGNRKYKDTYIKTVNNQLRAIFNFAFMAEYISKNPIANLPSVGSKESNRDYITWSNENIRLFLDNIRDYEDAFIAYNILFYTGLRKGELLALTVSDFDYERRKLHVNKTYSRRAGEDYVRPPKTEHSDRHVDLPAFVADLIQGYIELEYKPSPTQRIFQSLSDSFLDTALNAGCKRTGLPKIRIHDSRHSHVTNLSEMNIPLKEIGDRVGQKSKNITLHYAHSTDKGKAELIEKLEKEGSNYNVK